MKEFIDEYLVKILDAIIVILLIAILIIFVFDIKIPKKEEEVKQDNDVALVTNDLDKEEVQTYEEEEIKYYVDVKGAVKKPGVYEVNKDMIINDVIKLAGGLKSTASTKYLNLSKKVTNEMVIYIYTSSELKNLNVTNNSECIVNSEDIKPCEGASIIETNDSSNESNNSSSTPITDNKTPVNNSSDKININTATLEQLTSISGIGEAKAQAILDYRNTKGKFSTIEDIKNVSGIGDALYEKIKNSITV